MKSDAVERLVGVARRLERERLAAKPIVAALHRTLPEQWEQSIPKDWLTVGFVQEVVEASRNLLSRDARTAAALAQFAIVIVGNIADDSGYPPLVVIEAEATAWKELANAHRYLSAYDAAIRALDAAERCLEKAPVLSYDRAVVHFARALVFCEMLRFDEAAELLQESVRAFSQCDDRRRLGHCLHLQGMIEQRRGQLRKACTTYEEAIAVLRGTDDLYSLGPIYNNLAQAWIDLGDTNAAVTALHDAFAIFVDLGMTGEIARVRWVLGRVLLGSGQYQQARDVLAEVRMTFLGLSMPEEAGLAGLELVEACLALGRTQIALAVVEQVTQEFVHARLNERAVTALAYLREVIPTTDHAREAVRHVKAYVEQLRHEPLREFVALPAT